MEQNITFENGSTEAKLVQKVVIYGFLGQALNFGGLATAAVTVSGLIAWILGSASGRTGFFVALAINTGLSILFSITRARVIANMAKISQYIEKYKAQNSL